jgi:serine-type D-Ala-D-Ala carboxypeptidase (penicillin-binding protein 5/6)
MWAVPPRRRGWVRQIVRLFSLVALLAALGGTGFVAWQLQPWSRTAQADVGRGPATVIEPETTAAPPPETTTPPETEPAPPPVLSTAGMSRKQIKGVRMGAGIVVDAGSGRALWGFREREKMAIASLTKVMTALEAVRGGQFARVVTVPKRWLGIGGSSLYMRPGQKITVRKLLTGLLMVSGNDAANVLASLRAGSVKSFVTSMNQRAGQMGLESTRFSSPSGLTDRGNHSTAADMAVLVRELLRNPLLARIVRTKTEKAPHNVTWVNHNKLLFRYDGAIGVKTGYTDLSGPCLAAAARRGGRTLIAIVLKARGDEFDMASRMLDWGFRHRTA